MPRIISRLSLSQKPWELVSKVDKFGINLKLHSSALTFRKQNAFSFIRLAARPAKRSALDLADFYPQGQSRIVVAETKTVGVVPKSTKNPQCERDCSCTFIFRHEQQKHGLAIDNGGDENWDMYGYYKCRGPCTLVFATDATRKRYFSCNVWYMWPSTGIWC